MDDGYPIGVLAAFGLIPAAAPHSLITVPISFLARMQIGLFRSVGDLTYVPVATTGNLMRLVEAGYDGIVEKDMAARKASRVYAALIGAFACGAVGGAFATRAWGLHAIWVPAGCLAVTLLLFLIDPLVPSREGRPAVRRAFSSVEVDAPSRSPTARLIQRRGAPAMPDRAASAPSV